jgi:hypothetical protein
MNEFITDLDWSVEEDGSLLLSDEDGEVVIQIAMSHEQRLSLAIVLISASMDEVTFH